MSTIEDRTQEQPWRTSPPRRRWWPLPGTRSRTRWADLGARRAAAATWCPCGRRARTVSIDVRAPGEPQGRCRAHERVPAVWPWLIDGQTAVPRPMLAGERWGQPLACAVPLLVEELLGMTL